MSKINIINGKRVVLDIDLADLYQVQTHTLIQAVRRNKDRFPEDFMFPVPAEEARSFMLQTMELGWPGRPKPQYAFTELGVVMLSTVLNSRIANLVNVQVIEIFTSMQEVLLAQEGMMNQMDKTEKKWKKEDGDIALVFQYLDQLLSPSQPVRRQNGSKKKNGRD